jgi:hypothetical protein
MQRYTVYLYLKTALHVSGGTSTTHQERIQLYLQHLVFVTPLLLSAAIVEELEPVWVCCGWPTPPTAHSNLTFLKISWPEFLFKLHTSRMSWNIPDIIAKIITINGIKLLLSTGYRAWVKPPTVIYIAVNLKHDSRMKDSYLYLQIILKRKLKTHRVKLRRSYSTAAG